MAYGPAEAKLTLRPIPEPADADAIGVHVECANPDFLLPGGKPVQFDIAATNYGRTRSSGRFTFQVCDYLTRQAVAERVTPFELEPGRKAVVPTEVPLKQPGPYRGRVVVQGGPGRPEENDLPKNSRRHAPCAVSAHGVCGLLFSSACPTASSRGGTRGG